MAGFVTGHRRIIGKSMSNQALCAFSLDGKTALVTGASSGIGQAQSLALARAGASVVLVGRREAALAATLDSIEAINATAFVLPMDLHDRSAFQEFSQLAISKTGAIDIVINAAGVNYREPTEKISPESWDETINLNLSVPFFLAREFVPGMQSRGWGRIINIASLQTARAFTNGMAYGASKGGIGQVTRAMAESWSASGIGCNAIAPGFFPTELTAPVFEQSELSEKLAAQTAIGRNGELADLDGITVFLASPASNYITGQIVYVDGGFTAK